jgi:hypothetical protein
MEAVNRRLNSMIKQRGFAWAKYYELANNANASDYAHYQRLQQVLRTGEEASLPVHIKNEFIEMAKELRKTWECPICLEFIQPDNLDITPCGHYYCKPCLHTIKAQPTPKCGVCRRKLKANEAE